MPTAHQNDSNTDNDACAPSVYRVYVYKNYKNFQPSLDLAPTIEMLLCYVPAENLVGLKYIELTNSDCTRHMRRGKTWSRGKKVRLVDCLGFYYGDHITILADNMIRWIPSSAHRWSLMKGFTVAWVLYHEIGHHIHLAQRPEYREKEDVADHYRDKLLRKYMRTRYRYTWRLIRLGAKFLRWRARYR